MRHPFTAVCLALLLPASAAPQRPTNNPTGKGLILALDEGDRRIRRPRPEGAGRAAAPGIVIKVNRHNGGSSDFFMAYEEIRPGDSASAHRHPHYEEILLVHRGEGVATLGSTEARVTDGTTIFVPPNIRVALRNTGKRPLQLFYLFPRPETVEAYYDELTVKEGQPAKPFSQEEFAAFRARHRDHIIFE